MALDGAAHVAQMCIVDAHDDGAVLRNAVGELHERRLQVVEVPVRLEVLAIDVRDDGEPGRQLQERSITLVGFRDEIFAASEPGIAAE